MLENPHIADAALRHTAVIRFTIPRAEIQQVMGPAHREVMAAVAAQGMKPAGAWFSHHFKMHPDMFDFEVGVPVLSPITASGRVVAATLPAARVARAVYCGPYEGLGAGWGEFMAWMAEEDLQPADELWEFYLAGPETGTDAAAWRTELNRPLKLPA